jgi:DUF4097 and DUF4098 domain-containing protein YvlB
MSTNFRIMAAVLLLAAGQSSAHAGQVLDQSWPLAADGSVTVINVAGDITITAWDRDEVHLRGELGDESRLDISDSPQSLRLEVRPHNGKNFGRNYHGSELILSVPATATVSATGVSSDIEIRGLRGNSLNAETVSGDVEVEAQVTRAELKSVSGDVLFAGNSQRTSAETVSGDVELSGVAGELNVSVVSGDVELRGGSLERGRFEAVSGSLELEFSLPAGGDVSVQSMSGDVNVALPGNQNVEIRAQTFSGTIRSRFGSPQKASRGPGSRLEHTAGGGGSNLSLESFSGDVEISQQ